MAVRVNCQRHHWKPLPKFPARPRFHHPKERQNLHWWQKKTLAIIASSYQHSTSLLELFPSLLFGGACNWHIVCIDWYNSDPTFAAPPPPLGTQWTPLATKKSCNRLCKTEIWWNLYLDLGGNIKYISGLVYGKYVSLMLRDCLYLITHAFPNIMGYLQYDIGTKLVNTTVTGKLYVNATWRPLQLPQLASLMHQSPCQASSQQRTFSHMSDRFNTIVEQKHCKKVLHISVNHISCILSCIYVANPNIQTLSRIQVSFWNQWIKDKISKHPWTWNYNQYARFRQHVIISQTCCWNASL